jgi:cytochrome d ubiquinol oxidase subunit I
VPVDWLAVIFNPSFPYRLAHMVVAAFLATALVVGASGAWHLLRGATIRRAHDVLDGDVDAARPRRRCRRSLGDLHGLNTLEHQPAKIAAMEGTGKTRPGEGVPCCCSDGRTCARSGTRFAVGRAEARLADTHAFHDRPVRLA